MEQQEQAPRLIHFGVFELDMRTGELRKGGLKLRLQGQPVEVLKLLLERPGELVTREELEKRLWVGDTVVEFEHSINAAVNRLREALGDSADNPRYVETLARRGYRFVYPVEVGAHGGAPAVAPMPAPILPGSSSRSDRDDGDIAATAVGARHGVPLPRRWIVAATSGAVIATFAVLLVFNVAGLRDWVKSKLGISPPGTKIESLAVLPLENLSGDPQQEYFADGMTDALITDLGQISALRVISRQSVMRYKGTQKSVAEIARELKVDAVVEGAVLRSGDRVRITANLIYAPSDRHLWAEAYDRDLRDVLSLQNEIASAISQQVQAKLTPPEQTRLARSHTVDPQAFELYLKGRDWQWRGDNKMSMQCFQEAVDRDPSFARGYIGLASAYSRLGHALELPAKDAFAKVKVLGRKALDLDDGLAEGHLAIADGLIFGEWDWLGAERELRRAVEVNPNSDSARRSYSHYLSMMARHQEAIEEAKRALEINPRSAWSFHGLGAAYFFFRRYDQTLEQCKMALEVDPSFEDPHELSAWCYVEKSLYANGLAEFTKVHPPSRNVPAIIGHMGNAFARTGQRADAHKAIQKLVEASKQKRGTYEVALVYAGLGDKDRAFDWLEKAYNVHDKGLCYLMVDPCLDPLRSDRRFQDLLRRMNFPQ